MAMKEYEMTAVSEGQADEEYFGDTAIGTNSNGVDAGQRSLLEAEALRSDQNTGGSERAEDGQGSTVWCGCLSLRFYQQFFDVDTADVMDRWLQSVLSCKREKGFLELINNNPDAYGPFWRRPYGLDRYVCQLVEFTMMMIWPSLMGNLSYASASPGVASPPTGTPFGADTPFVFKERGYDLSTLVTSTWVVYGFAVVAPVALWLLLNQLEIPLSLIQAVCTYGYSLGPFLPAVLLCAIPLPFMSVAALSAACVASVIFLLRTLTPKLLEKNMGLAAPIMAGMGVYQAVLALVLEFAFFS